MALNDDDREVWQKAFGGAVFKEYVWIHLYRNRNQIEAQYRNFKSFIGGERLFATQTAYIGKLFLFTLATSLRTRLSRTMRQTAEETHKPIPGNSLDKVLERLAGVVIRRYGSRQVWKPEMITKK